MPTLPSLPGAPALLRPPAAVSGLLSAVNRATLLVADATIIARIFGASQWGVYLKGKPIVEADSVVSFDYRQDNKIADYPMEKGAFQSYNKTATPYESRVRLTKGGSEADRAKFLSALEKAAASLDLYEVITPERTYIGANIQRINYERTASAGVGLIAVDIWLLEVRETVGSEFASTARASGAKPFNLGQVSAVKDVLKGIKFGPGGF